MNELLTLVTAQQSTLQSQQADIRQVTQQSQFYHYYYYYYLNIELGDKTTTNSFHDSMRQRNTILMVTMFRQIREEFLGIPQSK